MNFELILRKIGEINQLPGTPCIKLLLINTMALTLQQVRPHKKFRRILKKKSYTYMDVECERKLSAVYVIF